MSLKEHMKKYKVKRRVIDRDAKEKMKAKSPEAHNPAKKEWVNQTPEYQRGWKDVDLMLRGGFSPYFTYMTVVHLGFSRKSATQSDPALYEYCEGCWARLDRLFKGKTPSPTVGA